MHGDEQIEEVHTYIYYRSQIAEFDTLDWTIRFVTAYKIYISGYNPNTS